MVRSSSGVAEAGEERQLCLLTNQSSADNTLWLRLVVTFATSDGLRVSLASHSLLKCLDVGSTNV